MKRGRAALVLGLLFVACRCDTELKQVAHCTIGNGQSFQEGELNPANPCESCELLLTDQAWSPLPDGTTCPAGGTCLSGHCWHAPDAGAVLDAGPDSDAGPGDAGNPDASIDWDASCCFIDAGLPPPCDGGGYLVGGTCVLGCTIDGGLFAPGELVESYHCQFCVPDASTTKSTTGSRGTYCPLNDFLESAGTCEPWYDADAGAILACVCSTAGSICPLDGDGGICCDGYCIPPGYC